MREGLDGARERYRLRPRGAPGLRRFAGRVHLDVDVEGLDGGCVRGGGGGGGEGGGGGGVYELASGFGEELGFLLRVDAGDAPEVGDLAEVLAVVCFCGC